MKTKLTLTLLLQLIFISRALAGALDKRLDIYWIASEVAGLKKIDHLVCTHYHIDHFGGASRLATLIPIGIVYDNGKFEGGWERPKDDYLQFKCDERKVINPGDVIPPPGINDNGLAPHVQLQCLAARKQFIPVRADAPKNP